MLTDYDAIPRILPEVKTSVVRERGGGRMVVEQEVVARMLFFSRRLHLLLEVQEDADSVSFRDACGRSFALYSGVWRIWIEDGLTQIAYELSAQPAFDVPAFVLTRLLNRDAKRMIARLSAEMAARVLKAGPPQSTRIEPSIVP